MGRWSFWWFSSPLYWKHVRCCMMLTTCGQKCSKLSSWTWKEGHLCLLCSCLYSLKWIFRSCFDVTTIQTTASMPKYNQQRNPKKAHILSLLLFSRRPVTNQKGPPGSRETSCQGKKLHPLSTHLNGWSGSKHVTSAVSNSRHDLHIMMLCWLHHASSYSVGQECVCVCVWRGGGGVWGSVCEVD